MAGDLITLPIRMSGRAVALALRGTEYLIGRGLSIAGRLAGRDGEVAAGVEELADGRGAPASETAAASDTTATSAAASDTTVTSEIAATPEAVAASETAAASEIAATPPSPLPPEPEPALYAETPPEPAHVSEEPQLVEEFAEPGAEDGAGAQIRIEEPWRGYARMRARDVIARIGAATAAELAGVELYERANLNRQTVLSAAAHQLQLVSRQGTAG